MTKRTWFVSRKLGRRNPLGWRLFAFSLLAACASTPLPAPLPLDRALGHPEGQLPFQFSFSRDSERVSYLLRRGEDGIADLWEIEIATGKRTLIFLAEGATTLSPEEKAERERRRERGKGITRYWRNPVDDSFLFVIDGDLHVLRDGQLKRLTHTPAPELSPKWSPDGKSIAFVREKNLFVTTVEGEEVQLTTSGGGTVECGLADFIAAEELGRDDGFWWSPDSTKIAYVETDSSDVPVFRMPGLDERGTPVEQRYPRPGDPNAKWKLEVVGVGGGEPVRMPVEGEYLARAGWTPAGDVYAEVSDRLQQEVVLQILDPGTGEWRAKFGEGARSETWDTLDDVHFCRDGKRVEVVSGWLFVDMLPVAMDVQGIVGLGGDRQIVFTRAVDGGLARQLCVVDAKVTRGVSEGRTAWVQGGEKIVRSGGWRSYEPNDDCTRLVEVASRAGVPPQIRVIDLDGNELVEIARGEAVGDLPKPEFFTIPAEDGLPMRAMLIRPAGKGPHPAIIHCYGGPGAQMVADRWGGSTYLWHARMAQMGYAILVVDNRGSGGYGDKVMKSVHGHLLDFEVRDQTAAARWLAAQPWIDAKRIGIWGWSYGGTLSLMCLLRAPDVFAAAVSVAPVTDWRDYDTAYTERYLGLPADDPQAYDRASPLTYAATLKRPLLLAHGMSDDNVHFRNATAFVAAAQKAGCPIETDFYPKGAHGIGGPTERRLLFARMEGFWEAHLAVR